MLRVGGGTSPSHTHPLGYQGVGVYYSNASVAYRVHTAGIYLGQKIWAGNS